MLTNNLGFSENALKFFNRFPRLVLNGPIKDKDVKNYLENSSLIFKYFNMCKSKHSSYPNGFNSMPFSDVIYRLYQIQRIFYTGNDSFKDSSNIDFEIIKQTTNYSGISNMMCIVYSLLICNPIPYMFIDNNGNACYELITELVPCSIFNDNSQSGILTKTFYSTLENEGLKGNPDEIDVNDIYAYSNEQFSNPHLLSEEESIYVYKSMFSVPKYDDSTKIYNAFDVLDTDISNGTNLFLFKPILYLYKGSVLPEVELSDPFFSSFTHSSRVISINITLDIDAPKLNIVGNKVVSSFSSESIRNTKCFILPLEILKRMPKFKDISCKKSTNSIKNKSIW